MYKLDIYREGMYAAVTKFKIPMPVTSKKYNFFNNSL